MANCYFAKPHGRQHCYIPFLYVIDFKGALNFGEAQLFAWIVAWRSSLCRKMNCANSNKATPLLQGDVERDVRVITTESNLMAMRSFGFSGIGEL